ncbi:MAG: hypothetical protein HQL51_10570 [Magnetococcales bacterium]|nr:hypothetical protein [Magnetococcales bacterium]
MGGEEGFQSFESEAVKALQGEDRKVRFAAMEAQARVDFLLGLAHLEQAMTGVSDPDDFAKGWEAGVRTLSEDVTRELREDLDGDGSDDGEQLARRAVGEEAQLALARVVMGTQQRRWRRRQVSVSVAMENLKNLAAQSVDQETLNRLRDLARELIWRNRLLVGGDDKAREMLQLWNQILGWDRFVRDARKDPASTLEHLKKNPWRLDPKMVEMGGAMLEAMKRDRQEQEVHQTFLQTGVRQHHVIRLYGMILDGMAGVGEITQAKVELGLKSWEFKRLRDSMSVFHKETAEDLKNLELCASDRFDPKKAEHRRAASGAWMVVSGLVPPQDVDDQADRASSFSSWLQCIPERIREVAGLGVLSSDPATATAWGVFIEELEDRLPEELLKFTPEQKGTASLMALGVPPEQAVERALKGFKTPAGERALLEALAEEEGEALLEEARELSAPRQRWSREQLARLLKTWPKRLARYLAIHSDPRWAARMAWRDADLEPRPKPDDEEKKSKPEASAGDGAKQARTPPEAPRPMPQDGQSVELPAENRALAPILPQGEARPANEESTPLDPVEEEAHPDDQRPSPPGMNESPPSL